MLPVNLTRSLAMVLCFLIGDDTPELRRRADEFVSIFQNGQVESIMAMWSATTPAKASDRRRLSGLVDDRLDADVKVGSVDEDRGVVQLQIQRKAPVPVLVEEYALRFKKEDGQWRILSLESSKAEEASRLIAAASEQREQFLKQTPPTLGLIKELVHRGIEYLDSGQIKDAVPAVTLAAQLAERVGDIPARAAAMRASARLDTARGDFAAAANHFESSLKLAESAGDRRGAAKALNGLANVDWVKGDRARAESRWNSALEIFRQAGDRAGEARALASLGGLRNFQGNYREGKANLEESLRIYTEIQDVMGRSIALNNLGVAYRVQGAYNEAQKFFEESLALSRRLDDVEGIASALGNLGNVYSGQGNYMKALEAYQESMNLNERIGNIPGFAGSLLGLGTAYMFLGNYPQAIEYLEKAYAVAERSRFKIGMALTLHNIGGVWSRRGELHRGLEYYEKALAINTEVGNRSAMAMNLHDIGKTYKELGNPREAQVAFEKSLEIAGQINDPVATLLNLASLTELARQSNEFQKGLDFAKRAMQVATDTGLPESIEAAHLVTGRLYRRIGRLADAQAEIEKAVAIVEEIRRSVPGEELAQQAFESRILPYHEMVGILIARGKTEAAFEYAERAKGRVLLDVLRQGRSDVSGAMTQAERDREQELLTPLVQLNRDLRGKTNAAGQEQIRTKLQAARLDYDAFLTTLYAAHPQLQIARGEMSPIRIGEVDELLKDRVADAFVEFVVTDEATHVFVLTRKNVRSYTIPIAQKTLDEQVRSFRESLAGRELTYAPAAQKLFNELLRPIDRRIAAAKRICIIPDGSLWELPFQALQSAADRFVLDRHSISYAPSITVLRETIAKRKARPPQKRAQQILALGNPTIPTAVVSRVRAAYRDASLDPLPETETEVRRIAALYGPRESRICVGQDAREEVIKRDAKSFRTLHFATHGILDDQSPLYSRLLLSAAESGSEDGVLEAREIMRLDLDADLAVMSACETGRGRVGAGEGLIGMSWAFFVAGCSATVVSQWKVGSDSTADLMVEFHRQLKASSRADALRTAALKLRSQPRYRHPFYWAPFVLIGQ
jgi:CHAT domain-containing protein/tetratricopeptide (TPR) repeat protein